MLQTKELCTSNLLYIYVVVIKFTKSSGGGNFFNSNLTKRIWNMNERTYLKLIHSTHLLCTYLVCKKKYLLICNLMMYYVTCHNRKNFAQFFWNQLFCGMFCLAMMLSIPRFSTSKNIDEISTWLQTLVLVLLLIEMLLQKCFK